MREKKAASGEKNKSREGGMREMENVRTRFAKWCVECISVESTLSMYVMALVRHFSEIVSMVTPENKFKNVEMRETYGHRYIEA